MGACMHVGDVFLIAGIIIPQAMALLHKKALQHSKSTTLTDLVSELSDEAFVVRG